ATQAVFVDSPKVKRSFGKGIIAVFFAVLQPANPDISPEVEEIVLHAMERNPDARYQSAAAMKAELDAPQTVTLAGRDERLNAPALLKPRSPQLRVLMLSLLRVLMLSLLLAVILAGLFFVFVYRLQGR